MSVGSPIGFHVEGPTRPDVQDRILNGMARLEAAGRHVACMTFVEDPGFLQRVKQRFPKVLCLGRKVFGANDPNPGFPMSNGQTWFSTKWPYQPPHADVYQFTNEWFQNFWGEGETRAVGQFFIELMDAANAAGVKVTILDAEMGALEPQHITWLADCLSKAEREGHYLNYHGYSANNDAGKTDMAAGEQWFFMRPFEDLHLDKLYPNLKIIYGEAGNSGDHLFRPETPNLMRQASKLLQPFYPHPVVGISWWEIVDPGQHADFGGDDYSSILDQVFDLLIAA